MPISINDDDLNAAGITFILPDQQSRAVSVVGSFNDWTPGANLMHPDENGQLVATVAAPYELSVYFRYLAEDDVWFDDPDVDTIEGMGGVIPAITRPKAEPTDPAPNGGSQIVDLSDATQEQPTNS